MTPPYTLTATPRQRLQAWLEANGLRIEQHRKTRREFIPVARRQGSPMKLWLSEQFLPWNAGQGYVARADRKSHRSVRLEHLLREFNEAEKWITGAGRGRIEADVFAQLAELSDHEVQVMVDYYAEHPIGVDQVGKGKSFAHLASLATSLIYREAYALEPARRDAAAARVVIVAADVDGTPVRMLRQLSLLEVIH